jgi:hypothetical protein
LIGSFSAAAAASPVAAADAAAAAAAAAPSPATAGSGDEVAASPFAVAGRLEVSSAEMGAVAQALTELVAGAATSQAAAAATAAAAEIPSITNGGDGGGGQGGSVETTHAVAFAVTLRDFTLLHFGSAKKNARKGGISFVSVVSVAAFVCLFKK